MAKKLTALEQFEQAVDRYLHVVGARIRLLIQPVCLGVLLASFLVLCYGRAQAAPAQHRGHVNESVERIGIDFDKPVTDVSTLAPKLVSHHVGEGIKFFCPIAPECGHVPKEGANKQRHGSNDPGMSSGKAINSTEHKGGWSIYIPAVLSFFVGFIGVVAINMWRYGINSEWRTLMFILEFDLGLPIPYWLYFVPKDEQDL